MSLKFQIRRAHKEDLEAIIALDRKTTNAPHWAESDYRSAVEGAPSTALQRCLLLAEQEGGDHRLDLIGFAVGKAIGSGVEATAELESVVVVEQARRSGVGRALCAAIIQWCRALDIPKVDLEVSLFKSWCCNPLYRPGIRSDWRAKGVLSRPGRRRCPHANHCFSVRRKWSLNGVASAK